MIHLPVRGKRVQSYQSRLVSFLRGPLPWPVHCNFAGSGGTVSFSGPMHAHGDISRVCVPFFLSLWGFLSVDRNILIGRELVSASAMLVVALTFIAVSLRAASDEAMMLHLVISVLSASMLPVLLVCECRFACRGVNFVVTLHHELRTLRC